MMDMAFERLFYARASPETLQFAHELFRARRAQRSDVPRPILGTGRVRVDVVGVLAVIEAELARRGARTR